MTAPATASPLGQEWNPSELIDCLAAGWYLGEPESFIAHFHLLWHPDIVSTQPLTPKCVGLPAVENQFRQTFKLLPRATATITSWEADQPHVYVAFELRTADRRHPLSLHTQDRFTLIDGLITERSVTFPSGILLRYLARHPSRWPAALSVGRFLCSR